MVAAVTSVTPVISSEGVAANITLQPGSVIDAQVLKVLANDLVRIAVASLSIDVLSQVPLQEGQQLQLAVSQTQDGVRLQIVPQDADAFPASNASSPATIVTTSGPASSPSAQSTSGAVSVARVLTPLEAIAVSAALQSAAARQNGLSPLFANAGVAASSQTLPPALQQAAARLLSVRPELNDQLTGETIKAAFQQSGLFLEQSHATQAAGATPNNAPDLKAALIVFRQVLSSWNGEGSASAADGEPQATASFAQQGQQRANADISQSLSAPPLAPEIEFEEVLLPQAAVAAAHDIDDLAASLRDVTPGAANGAGSAALQALARNLPEALQQAVAALLNEETEALSQGRGAATDAGAGTKAGDLSPPPPYRGAAPAAQAVASPSIDAKTAPDAAVHKLIDDTDAALARQTLLQIASLPDQVNAQSLRPDNIPRWNFEIPFVTPQGTAVAQFEISRDGSNGADHETQGRVWRARFSLNVEPAGPVHALVSLSGERTSVRMWAERKATAQELRANSGELAQALRAAELTPGDIMIGEGSAPASPSASQRGHFLDRAS